MDALFYVAMLLLVVAPAVLYIFADAAQARAVRSEARR